MQFHSVIYSRDPFARILPKGISCSSSAFSATTAKRTRALLTKAEQMPYVGAKCLAGGGPRKNVPLPPVTPVTPVTPVVVAPIVPIGCHKTSDLIITSVHNAHAFGMNDKRCYVAFTYSDDTMKEAKVAQPNKMLYDAIEEARRAAGDKGILSNIFTKMYVREILGVAGAGQGDAARVTPAALLEMINKAPGSKLKIEGLKHPIVFTLSHDAASPKNIIILRTGENGTLKHSAAHTEHIYQLLPTVVAVVLTEKFVV